MAFKRFTQTKFRLGKSLRPTVSIWKQGQIAFNKSAVDDYKLSNYQYAVLFYDEEARAVGIMFTNDKNEDGAIKVISRGKGGYSISGKAFLHVHKIDYSEVQKYPLEWDGENSMYVFKLN